MDWDESLAWRPDLIGTSEDILPFFDSIADRIPRNGVYAEVGVFLGRSLIYMAHRRSDISLVAIDPWMNDTSIPMGMNGEGCYQRFLKQLEVEGIRKRVMVIRGSGPTGLAAIPRADMVFIDGNHDYPYPKQDIMAAQLLNPIILSGHDYGCEGVRRSINELGLKVKHVRCEAPASALIPGCWYVS